MHDLGGGLAPFLLPERSRHRHPLCVAFRDSGHMKSCVQFDVVRLRQEAAWNREGRIQSCPAGLVEWVAPAFTGARLRFMLFAGVAAGDGLDGELGVVARVVARHPSRPPTVTADRARLVLESLRQLAARLTAWLAEEAPASPGQAPLREDRQGTIRKFIHEYYARDLSLEDLARHLGLSPSRTRAVVAQTCGASFVDLLTEARLASAADLLRHTGLPIADISLRSGFSDPSHFFRSFRRRHGTTPLQYRRQADMAGGA